MNSQHNKVLSNYYDFVVDDILNLCFDLFSSTKNNISVDRESFISLIDFFKVIISALLKFPNYGLSYINLNDANNNLKQIIKIDNKLHSDFSDTLVLERQEIIMIFNSFILSSSFLLSLQYAIKFNILDAKDDLNKILENVPERFYTRFDN